MIKDVMVWVDSSLADEIRLGAAGSIARQFDSQVSALVLNPMPLLGSIEGASAAVAQAELLEKAREARETSPRQSSSSASSSSNDLWRFDGSMCWPMTSPISRRVRRAPQIPSSRYARWIPSVWSRAFCSNRAGICSCFRRPNGRKLRSIASSSPGTAAAKSARAVAEGMPFLRQAKEVTVAVITDKRVTEQDALVGADAVNHLKHHGIGAVLHRVNNRKHDVGAALLAEARRRKVDVIVMGGYGQFRLRERLLGGVTYNLMHEAPVPIVIAH